MDGFELLLSAAEILEKSSETTLTAADISQINVSSIDASFVHISTSTPTRRAPPKIPQGSPGKFRAENDNLGDRQNSRKGDSNLNNIRRNSRDYIRRNSKESLAGSKERERSIRQRNSRGRSRLEESYDRDSQRHIRRNSRDYKERERSIRRRNSRGRSRLEESYDRDSQRYIRRNSRDYKERERSIRRRNSRGRSRLEESYGRDSRRNSRDYIRRNSRESLPGSKERERSIRQRNSRGRSRLEESYDRDSRDYIRRNSKESLAGSKERERSIRQRNSRGRSRLEESYDRDSRDYIRRNSKESLAGSKERERSIRQRNSRGRSRLEESYDRDSRDYIRRNSRESLRQRNSRGRSRLEESYGRDSRRYSRDYIRRNSRESLPGSKERERSIRQRNSRGRSRLEESYDRDSQRYIRRNSRDYNERERSIGRRNSRGRFRLEESYGRDFRRYSRDYIRRNSRESLPGSKERERSIRQRNSRGRSRLEESYDRDSRDYIRRNSKESLRQRNSRGRSRLEESYGRDSRRYSRDYIRRNSRESLPGSKEMERCIRQRNSGGRSRLGDSYRDRDSRRSRNSRSTSKDVKRTIPRQHSPPNDGDFSRFQRPDQQDCSATVIHRTASQEIPSPAYSPLSLPKRDEQQDGSDVDYVPDADESSSSTEITLQRIILDDFTIYEVFEKYQNLSQFLPEPEEENDQSGFDDDPGFEELCEVEYKKSKNKPMTNKEKRERGLSYATYKGIIIPARSIKSPCYCKRLKCDTKYDDNVRQQLLKNMLKLPMSGQEQFIANHIEVFNVKKHRVVNSKRKYSFKYYLPGAEGKNQVCLEMFLSTLDLGEKRVRILAAKIVEGNGVCGGDGRKENRNPNTLDADTKKLIEDHILSFPAYTSHLGREKSSKLYLSSDLNITKMHDLYVKQCEETEKDPVCYNTYRMIFRTFKLSFIKPKLDRCNECEQFRIQLKVADAVTRPPIAESLEKHQAAAKSTYNTKKSDVSRAKQETTICTASFDLQKCLPTPHLRCGMAYYKRQLYTYNLTVFFTINGKNGAKCYLWNETVAKRGSQEIASCLYQFIQQIKQDHPTVTEFTFYSDRCGGQNMNFTMCMLFSFVAEQCSRAKLNITIRHNFMVSGHSHMEVDSVHAGIERAKKATSIDIEIPRDWAVFIAQIKRKVPLEVIELDQSLFFGFKSLTCRYKKPRVDEEGNTYKFTEIYSFEYRSNDIGKVFFKENLQDESYRVFVVANSTNLISSDLLEPTRMYKEPLQLSQEKLTDLKSLLPFIVNKAYYETMLKSLSAPKRGRKQQTVDDNCFDNDMDQEGDDCIAG